MYVSAYTEIAHCAVITTIIRYKCSLRSLFCHPFWEGSLHPAAFSLDRPQEKGEPLVPSPAPLLFTGSNKYGRFIGASYTQTSRRAFKFTLYIEALASMWTQSNLFIDSLSAFLCLHCLSAAQTLPKCLP